MRNLLILISLSIFCACAQNSEKKIVYPYILNNADIQVRIDKLNYQLPDIIYVSVSCDHSENKSIELSLDKTYKKNFMIESFHKNMVIGSEPDRILHQYFFAFSGLRPGKKKLPPFSIKLFNNTDTSTIKTKEIPLLINGSLNNKETTELKPIITNISNHTSLIYWGIAITIMAIVIFYIKRIQKNKADDAI